MKKCLAFILTAAMAASLAACGGGSSSSASAGSDAKETTAAGETAAAEAAPAGEKILKFGESDPKVGYDPQTNTNSGATTVEECVVEGLYRWDDNNELQCCLAEDLPAISDDGLVYSFKLREGVKFHDGSDLTTEDVKYTFERMFKPETGAKSTYMYSMIKGADAMLNGEATELEGFEIVDDYNFNITLNAPFSCFTQNLGILYAYIAPSEACEAAGADWGITTLIGTGPYTFTSSDAEKAVVSKFDGYWDENCQPKFDQIWISSTLMTIQS